MKFMIAHLGRLGTWLVLLFGALLLSAIVLRLVVGAVRAHLPIDPDGALANGGHVVPVQALCGPNAEPLGGDVYEVLTRSGRPPRQQSGQLASNLIQVIVGPDWVGEIRITKDRFWTDTVELTDVTGEPFGRHERQVHFAEC